jgi:ubiquinone/menaquinone biosynthesis C-methylase UbiE
MNEKRFWEKYFLTYDVLNEVIPYQKLMDDLIVALEADKGSLIFDAGSGTGNLCIRLKETGTRPIGFDLCDKAIEIHLNKDRNAEVFFGDMTKQLPFPDNYFDGVVSNNVLYTIDKDDRLNVIKEFHRVLKPNGKLVIANVHTGFNPRTIFIDHLKQVKNKYSRFKIACELLKKVFLIGKMFCYSHLIIKKHKSGKYAFMELDEQKQLLMQAGFKNIAETIYTYSGQSFMDIGVK